MGLIRRRIDAVGTVYLGCDAEKRSVLVLARLDGLGQARGHNRLAVTPGQTFRGYTYDELMKLGNGPHDLEPRELAESAAQSRRHQAAEG